MNLSSIPLILPPVPPTPILLEIRDCEKNLKEAELQVAALKANLNYLRQKHIDSIVIKWRDEVRDSLKGRNGIQVFNSYPVMLHKIEIKYTIAATRKIKNMLITTLSSMHKEGSIGKVLSGNIHYYGYKGLFEPDLVTVKNEHLKLFDNCRGYVENFVAEPE